MNKLDDIFAMPMVIVLRMETTEEPEMDLENIKLALNAGMMTKEQLLEQMNGFFVAYGELSDSLVKQSSVIFVKNEYEKIGVDVNKKQSDYLWLTGFKMIGVTLIMTVASVIVGFLASRTAAKTARDLRSGIFKKVLSFSNTEIDKFSAASLITRSTNDIQQVQMVVFMILRMVLYSPILGIGGVIKVMDTRTGMGWIIGVALGVVMLIVAVLISVAMPKFFKMQTLIDKLNLVSREIITGIPVIRAFNRENREKERFNDASRDLMKTQLFTNRVMTFMMPFMMLLMNVIALTILWFGAKGVDAGNMQVGDMIAFITYTMQIVMSFMMLAAMSVMLPRANVSAKRIDDVLTTEPSIKEYAAGACKNADGDTVVGEVEFSNVSFRFPGAEDNVLHNISFKAKPGQTTAIIGSTGSGKSTLVNLLPRFYDVTDGAIYIDGTNIRDMTFKRLYSILGFIPQKGILFSGDIESNIKFSGDGISDADMEKAAAIAQAEDFILEKPDKYNDSIAQGGSNVSGGQKQRLSIARAVAKHPKVYIFDDSFSALDYKTDKKLRAALKAETGGSTFIIVAQRIATITESDNIIVLDKGKVVGQGTHQTLLVSCPEYLEIAKSQLNDKELGLQPAAPAVNIAVKEAAAHE